MVKLETLKRYSLHPDARKLACHWMVEEKGGQWVRFSDLEPDHKGGLSVKAARGIDALLGSVSIPDAKPDSRLEFEAYQFRRMLESIGIDVSKAILEGKTKPMGDAERDRFYELLRAFLRHQLKV